MQRESKFEHLNGESKKRKTEIDDGGQANLQKSGSWLWERVPTNFFRGGSYGSIANSIGGGIGQTARHASRISSGFKSGLKMLQNMGTQSARTLLRAVSRRDGEVAYSKADDKLSNRAAEEKPNYQETEPNIPVPIYSDVTIHLPEATCNIITLPSSAPTQNPADFGLPKCHCSASPKRSSPSTSPKSASPAGSPVRSPQSSLQTFDVAGSDSESHDRVSPPKKTSPLVSSPRGNRGSPVTSSNAEIAQTFA
ncbi:uncharacterized protein [Bemisia tabaci]|uniref:uncharacterized protein n=1 Tax=Bemisia tabaci TaxID=7038 RepID=UPI003B27D231